VQGKWNKMITSAAPPSHHRKATTVKTWSISYLIHSCNTHYVAVSVIIIMSHRLSTHRRKLQ